MYGPNSERDRELENVLTLFLSLAPRAGENTNLFEQFAAGSASFGHTEADNLFKGSFNEKEHSYSWPKGESIASSRGLTRTKPTARNLLGGDREIRQVPFERDNFREICNAFFVHSSISRAVSRADVPLFSCIDITISQDSAGSTEQPAIGLYLHIAQTAFLPLIERV